jgi:tetratricopeptide (TPR) repeat protein
VDRAQAIPWRVFTAGVLIALLLAAAWFFFRQKDSTPASVAVPPVTARFTGSASCAECHAQQAEAWQQSHHARAMQVAGEKTILGDFDNAEFRHAGIVSRFFRRDGKFLVLTDGPDGKLADFEVKYAFGVEPLQQYLIELPGGRLQPLGIAWDTARKRRFHLYPTERIDHRDELHWTGRQQNWNFMCADCHSIDVRKNYDAAANAFNTTWAEITVGCEACHGPGSAHVDWARSRGKDPTLGLTVRLNERRGAAWKIDPATGSAARSVRRATEREIEVCAQCHSRRAQFAEGYHAGRRFLDHYLPSLLTAPLYHADGQQRDEVYNWGSFLQSRMYAKGVTCGDCHEPHGGKLRAASPDAMCLACHAAERFAATKHHLHPPQSKGASCVECHMPATTYMVVDPRRDHGFRVPRPDLSAALGMPNACNGCHGDRTPEWAAERIEAAHGKSRMGPPSHAATLDAARRNHPAAPRLLAALASNPAAPAIVQATALHELGRRPAQQAVAAAERAVLSSDALVRMAALEAIEAFPVSVRVHVGAPLLADPVRVVRMAAGRLLADVPDATLSDAQRAARKAALAEYAAAQDYSADRPESRLNLGVLALRQGKMAEAEKFYRAALALAPDFAPAWANLADLHRMQGREEEGERVLREGLKHAPRSAELQHALGLLLVRRQRYDEGLAALAAAARLAPDNTRYHFVHAVGLHDRGRRNEAVKVLESALRRNAVDRDVLIVLAQYLSQQGRRDAALAHARKLVALEPEDPELRGFLARIERVLRQ